DRHLTDRTEAVDDPGQIELAAQAGHHRQRAQLLLLTGRSVDVANRTWCRTTTTHRPTLPHPMGACRCGATGQHGRRGRGRQLMLDDDSSERTARQGPGRAAPTKE